MPIQNLNGQTRKHGIANGRTIKGEIYTPGLASVQHGVTTVGGTSYNSPFTHSAKPLFTWQNNKATQPHLHALKVESPGQLVPVHEFVKIHPHEKGSFFSTNKAARPAYVRTGGPSQFANTPANPNAPALHATLRPQRKQPKLAPEKETNSSYLRSGGTLGGHANPDAGTSSDVARWSRKNG